MQMNRNRNTATKEKFSKVHRLLTSFLPHFYHNSSAGSVAIILLPSVMDTKHDQNTNPEKMVYEGDLYGLIELMAQNPSHNQNKRLEDIKTVIRGQKKLVRKKLKLEDLLSNAEKEDGRDETVLHTAIKLLEFNSDAEKEVLDILIDNFPYMLEKARGNSQTVLHMAVSKGNIFIAEKLLSKMSDEQKKVQLKCAAVGERTVFRNTVMMVELPLNIAAVTCNEKMFDLLLKHEADLDGTNSFGDNVCHSLVRYALLYPEKLQSVLDMCKHINKDTTEISKNTDYQTKAELKKELQKKIWLMVNQEGYTPMQLAARFGQHELFTYIMNLDGYCHTNCNDGLFDIKIYDVTELDAVSHMTSKELTGLEDDSNKTQRSIEDLSTYNASAEGKKVCSESTLQMLLQLEPRCAFQFLLFPPLRRIIDKKWEAYRWYFYIWFFLHFLNICFLTWYGTERAKQVYNTMSGFDNYKNPIYETTPFNDEFGIACGVFHCAIGIVYILEAVIRLVKGHMPWTLSSFTNPYGNGIFQAMFFLFGLLLIIDLPLAIWVRSYENYLLLVAIVLGWFLLCLFFLRALRPFSFFTVMIRKVLIGDLFRFFVILSCELIGFSAAIYMAIQGSNEIDSDFQSFGRVIVSMFKLMVGLGEFGQVYNTRNPRLAILLFIAFIILTTVLMINSLIAMLSRTCTELIENVGLINSRDMHWKLQRLSVVLYLESILPKFAIKRIGDKKKILQFNSKLNRRGTMTRYTMEIRSMNTQAKTNKDDATSTGWRYRIGQLAEHVLDILDKRNQNQAAVVPLKSQDAENRTLKSEKGKQGKGQVHDMQQSIRDQTNTCTLEITETTRCSSCSTEEKV